MNFKSPTFTEYYIPFYQPRGYPSIEKVARYMLSEALDGKKIRVYKNKSAVQAMANHMTDSDGFADYFIISVSDPCGWGVFVQSEKDHCGVRCSDKLRNYLDIQ